MPISLTDSVPTYTLDREYKVVLSDRLKSYLPLSALEQNFAAYAGTSIQMPDKLAEPAAEFLEYHREAIFMK